MHPKEEKKGASDTKKDLNMQVLDRPPSNNSGVSDEFKDFFKVRKDENDKSAT